MKGMKTLGLVMIALATAFWTAAPGWAGKGTGSGDCSGIVASVLTGDPVIVSGIVAGCELAGQGIQIDTGSEIVTVYGIGPQRFWDTLGLDRPAVGEDVTILAYEITLSDGSTRLIAFSIEIGDETVQLRDEEIGAPLWRQIKKSYKYNSNYEGENGQGGPVEGTPSTGSGSGAAHTHAYGGSH